MKVLSYLLKVRQDCHRFILVEFVVPGVAFWQEENVGILRKREHLLSVVIVYVMYCIRVSQKDCKVIFLT